MRVSISAQRQAGVIVSVGEYPELRGRRLTVRPGVEPDDDWPVV